MTISLGLDIGSNSVGSAWIDHETGEITVGLSVFPAGVDEADDKRGEPKNAKRRMTRRARITLARRAQRKRELRLKLIKVKLLPPSEEEFKRLLEQTEPWELRRKGLVEALTPFEFGRVLLHLSQRRGSLGFDAGLDDKGAMKQAITRLRMDMLDRYAADDAKQRARQLRERINLLTAKKKRTAPEEEEIEPAEEELKKLCEALLNDNSVTFGRFIADVRDERREPIVTEDRRKQKRGPREWRKPVRNRSGKFEYHANRAIIRDEFAKLWEAQKHFGGPLAELLTDDLRKALDDESGDSTWRHKGLMFGQRRQSWDLGTLGRCVLEPTERCAPHADMYASRYLVVETVNNLRIIEGTKPSRSLTQDERRKIRDFLSGPLGVSTSGKQKGQAKRTVTVTDLRKLMGTSDDGWGKASKTSKFRFNIEADEEREINTCWFSREIVHGSITPEKWESMPDRTREGINRAILRFNPDNEGDAQKLMAGLLDWAGLTEMQADAAVAAWRKRPRPDAKRLHMSRKAVRNVLRIMDEAVVASDRKPGEPIQWSWLKDVAFDPVKYRWPTQVEARMIIAADDKFADSTTCKPLDNHTRRRYATGAKGATARDRHYMRKHLLLKNGQPIFGPDGSPLHEPPPAPLISNPVVRKAIHEVRRHLVEYMTTFGRKPDEIRIELAREAKMGKVEADRHLFMIRLRNRIRNEIIRDPAFNLQKQSSTQQDAAVQRILLSVQQDGVCPLCGNTRIPTRICTRMAASGEGCELAHIVPRSRGGHNGLTNVVLAHLECNREMDNMTPREFWDQWLPGGFETGIEKAQQIYGAIHRIKPSEVKQTIGPELWKCFFTKPSKWYFTPTFKRGDYFTIDEDLAKVEQFKKEIKDVQEMTPRQLAATKYASRQVMSYLADSVYEGQGLPERGGERRIDATDGMWTKRLCDEWGLYFDGNGRVIENEDERRKNRRNHYHHAIDAIVTALCTPQLRTAWLEREKQAAKACGDRADEEALGKYRRRHRLPLPSPFRSADELHAAIRRAVFGIPGNERPICHRPVKRKLIGALHKGTLYGPVTDSWVQGGVLHRELVQDRVTVRQDILGKTKGDFLKPAHLRLPRTETDQEAVERLARRIRIEQGISEIDAIKSARQRVKSKGFLHAIVDPKPEKGGIVRDIGLRRLLRRRLEERGLNPDSYTKSQLKESIDKDGPLTLDSGVPIYRVILLWSNNDPVTIRRDHYDYVFGKAQKLDDPSSLRLYDSQNNHHIELRVATNKKGNQVWSGNVVSAFDVSKQISGRLRELTKLEKPFRHLRRALPKQEKEGPSAEEIKNLAKRRLVEWKNALRRLKPERKAIIDAHPIIDRSDNDDKRGKFVMSLCEGETLWMRHKRTGEVGYFVVAKLDKPQSIVVVPHWDARPAKERKDPNDTTGKRKIPHSKRDEFSLTPSDLKRLAPPGYAHAVKVRVSPLGKITVLQRD